MPLDSLEGRTYGPYPLRVCAEKVAEFVAVTGDDRERWAAHAPPGWAAACLFAVAPHLLGDPELAPIVRSVIHGEQRFSWEGPFRIEDQLEVSGRIDKIRERSGTYFVSFEMEVSGAGTRVAGGLSTFLMSGTGAPAGDASEESEPGPDDQGPAGPDQRSASRSDLVRYAAATRDWNPIHWDHAAAVATGLPGVVVHGLLQASWLLAAAAALGPGPAPLAGARFRFRAPLRPAVPAQVALEAGGEAVKAQLVGGDGEVVAGTITLR
jgi:acyl dehydratase